MKNEQTIFVLLARANLLRVPSFHDRTVMLQAHRHPVVKPRDDVLY